MVKSIGSSIVFMCAAILLLGGVVIGWWPLVVLGVALIAALLTGI